MRIKEIMIEKGRFIMGRVLFAGASSRCGKTTVSCVVLQAMKNRGIEVNSIKCGPDCFDAMFNNEVIGVKSYNIDSFMMDRNTIKYLINEHKSEITVMDGIKAYYDGIHFTRKASTYEISVYTKTPTVLVIDCSGMTTSVGAVIKGFMRFKTNMIKGVIFNRLNPEIYPELNKLCNMLKIRCFGYLPPIKSSAMENRPLSLVNQPEIEDLRNRLNKLAENAEKTLDIDGIIELSKTARELKYKPLNVPYIGKVRIAFSYDKAFCLYYRDNIELLKKMGAEIVLFSPLKDKALPENIDGLIICGGYPEMYTSDLSRNETMLESIRKAVRSGLPTIAECGGFMYLHDAMYDITGVAYSMAGVIEGRCYKSTVPIKYGYIELTSNTSNLLMKRGSKFKTYEYHIYESTNPGSAYTASKEQASWKCINATPTLYAGFPHLHFYTNTRMAEKFMRACTK